MVIRWDCRFVLMVHHKERGWEFPGGKNEDDESIVQTAIRELKEETGVEKREAQMHYLGYTDKEKGWINHVFVTRVRKDQEPVIQEPDKFDGSSWIPIDRLATISGPDFPVSSVVQEVIRKLLPNFLVFLENRFLNSSH